MNSYLLAVGTCTNRSRLRESWVRGSTSSRTLRSNFVLMVRRVRSFVRLACTLGKCRPTLVTFFGGGTSGCATVTFVLRDPVYARG